MPLTSAGCEFELDRVASMGTVLVVEDPLVSKLVRAVLQKHGYEVKVRTEAEAAALLQAGDSQVGVLLTNSPEAFLEFGSQVPLLYLTSSPNVLFQAAFRACRVVVKPFVPDELVRAMGVLTGTV